MAEQSFTGVVDTNGEWEQLSSVTSLTFSSGVKYTITIGGLAEIKIADAVFPVSNQNVYWTPSSSQMYIRNTLTPLSITVYGAE